MCTLEELDKIQKKDMFLQQHLNQSNRNKHEENIQLEDKEEEIKILKTEVVDLTKEVKELKTYDKPNKIIEVSEETKEMIISLKTQLEEAKEIEEALKIQLTKNKE
jgi:hypothetical protein